MLHGPRLGAVLPLCIVAGSLGAWLAACGPEGAAPEQVRTTGQRLEAYCTAPVTGSGTLDVENVYLPSVVHCENGGAPWESLKAQAVAARTFLYYKMETAGSIGDGQGDQVYSCGSGPTQEQIDAVKATSGQFLSYQGIVICSFYVAGSKQSPPACQGVNDVSTEKYVTYNWGLSGDGIHQSTLGWVDPGNKRNRGCMSQWGSRCLANDGWIYSDILKFYYGMDIKLETATGSCVVGQNTPPKGNLDGADCTSIRGWAQDPDDPTHAVEVHVSFDAPAGDPAAKTVTLTAGLDRQDLCQPLGSCNHGFELQVPLSLRDGAARAVHVEAVDTGGGSAATLTGSPGSFTCKVEAPLTPAQGVRRHVTSMDVFNAWKFSSLMDVAHLTDAELEAYPLGPDLPAAPSLAQGDDSSPEVWLLDTGVRRHVPSPAVMAAWRFDVATIKTMAAAQLYASPEGAHVRDYPFLMQGSGPAVYVLDDPLTGGSNPPVGDGGTGGSGWGKDSGADASQPGGGLYNKAPGQDEGCSCGAAGSQNQAFAPWLLIGVALGVRRKQSRDRKGAGGRMAIDERCRRPLRPS